MSVCREGRRSGLNEPPKVINNGELMLDENVTHSSEQSAVKPKSKAKHLSKCTRINWIDGIIARKTGNRFASAIWSYIKNFIDFIKSVVGMHMHFLYCLIFP